MKLLRILEKKQFYRRLSALIKLRLMSKNADY